MAGAWVLPSIIGPLVAGWVADSLSWRLVFLGVLPLIVPGLLMILPAVRSVSGTSTRDAGAPAPAVAPTRRGRKRLALAAALGAALLQYAGQHLVWTSLLALVAGLALLAPSLPRLLPPGTLRAARGLPTTVGMRGLLAGAFFGAEAFVPLMLVTERGLSTTLAGLSLTGAALGWAAGSWYQGRPHTRVPRSALVQLGSALVALAATGMALALWPALPAWTAAASWGIGGLGMGMATASVSVLVLEQSPRGDQGANSAALQMSDALGSMLAIGVSGALFAALHVAPGRDGPAFGAVFVAMSLVALLGVVVAPRVRPGRLRVPLARAGSAPQDSAPQDSAPQDTATSWSSASRRSVSSSPLRIDSR